MGQKELFDFLDRDDVSLPRQRIYELTGKWYGFNFDEYVDGIYAYRDFLHRKLESLGESAEECINNNKNKKK